MPLSDKLKRDWAPILFFGIVIIIKTYYLIVYLNSNEDLWGLLKNVDHIEDYGRGAAFYLTSGLTYVLYYAVALAFDTLVFFSFIARVGASERPTGFGENIIPLLTVFIPMIGFTLLFIPEVRQFTPGYSDEILSHIRKISPIFPFYITMVGTLAGLIGAAFSIWALSYLRRSFGLRAAVRELVTSGPYRWARHPLYAGEIIHILGIAILSATPVGLYLFAVAVILQVMRAKIEEKKFLGVVPEYRAYLDSTGFLWPRWRKVR